MFCSAPLILELLGMGAGEAVPAPQSVTPSYGGGTFLAITYPHEAKPQPTKKKIVGEGNVTYSARPESLGRTVRPPKPVARPATPPRPSPARQSPMPVQASRPKDSIRAIEPNVVEVPVAPVRNRRKEEEEFVALVLAGVI